MGFYSCVYHIHVHIAAHLVLEDDDVLQAHDLLATHQVPQQKSAPTVAELPKRLKPGRYRGQMLGGLGLWAGFVACKRVAKNQELAALTTRIAFIVIQCPASLF